MDSRYVLEVDLMGSIDGLFIKGEEEKKKIYLMGF